MMSSAHSYAEKLFQAEQLRLTEDLTLSLTAIGNVPITKWISDRTSTQRAYLKKLGQAKVASTSTAFFEHQTPITDAQIDQALMELRQLVEAATSGMSTSVDGALRQHVAIGGGGLPQAAVQAYCDRVKRELSAEAAVVLKQAKADLVALSHRPVGVDIRDKKKTSSIRLFISHSSADTELAFRLVSLLRGSLNLPTASIRCTSVDGYRLPGGADTDEVLRSEVLDAAAFIGVVSPVSLGSAYVLFELGARWGARKHLVPLLAPGTSPSELRGPLVGLNALRADSAGQMHQLVIELSEILAVAPERPQVYQAQIDRLVKTDPPVAAVVSTREPTYTPEPVRKTDRLSPESIELLREAVKDPQGYVFASEMDQGMILTANNREFVVLGNPRSEALGRRMLSELVKTGLLEDRYGTSSAYHVTDRGYDVADLRNKE